MRNKNIKSFEIKHNCGFLGIGKPRDIIILHLRDGTSEKHVYFRRLKLTLVEGVYVAQWLENENFIKLSNELEEN
tara:strand:+ start:1759 stop:1983 length:225 start_codon:yes stop_codon:yes gene_type:complete